MDSAQSGSALHAMRPTYTVMLISANLVEQCSLAENIIDLFVSMRSAQCGIDIGCTWQYLRETTLIAGQHPSRKEGQGFHLPTFRLHSIRLSIRPAKQNLWFLYFK